MEVDDSDDSFGGGRMLLAMVCKYIQKFHIHARACTYIRVMVSYVHAGKQTYINDGVY